jgi:hypothetical protein|tara:strand:+ start:3441 stop:3686 length:246 start_codon:yes stop_codon:yes gene_type:complete
MTVLIILASVLTFILAVLLVKGYVKQKRIKKTKEVIQKIYPPLKTPPSTPLKLIKQRRKNIGWCATLRMLNRMRRKRECEK